MPYYSNFDSFSWQFPNWREPTPTSVYVVSDSVLQEIKKDNLKKELVEIDKYIDKYKQAIEQLEAHKLEITKSLPEETSTTE